MKVQFMGAARAVTGSCFIIETDKVRFAVDCGMHQGNTEIEKRNWDVEIYEPSRIDFIVVTHAHIDHSGLLPRLVQKGFRGPVYATEPTGDLLKILLQDSAHIQEVEAGWKNKKMQRNGRASTAEPLYTVKDAQAVCPLLQKKTYKEIFSPAEGIKIVFNDAGHILGAAILEIFIKEKKSPVKLVFSGDLGRQRQLLMADPTYIKKADFLFLESTYGDRNHKGEEDSLDELAAAINYSYGRGQKVVIPAFAVERTQEILYSLHLLRKQGKLPEDMPVYLDSPLAIQATGIFSRYSSYLDNETKTILKTGDDPLTLPQLKYSLTTEQSQHINEMPGPAVVISASGMADAGRIKHHLRHNLWREGASIVFVGFQAEGTNGRKIVDGAGKIRLLGEDIAVKAKIFTINGFSAHAGQDQLLDWLGHFQNRKVQIFLVHGEVNAQKQLASKIAEKYGFAVYIPEYLEKIQLELGIPVATAEKQERIISGTALDATFDDLAANISYFLKQKETIKSLPIDEQIKIRNLMLEVNQAVKKISENF